MDFGYREIRGGACGVCSIWVSLFDDKVDFGRVRGWQKKIGRKLCHVCVVILVVPNFRGYSWNTAEVMGVSG